ncbi:hypothetical protein [Demequina flava]|uniref:hypothetical protein n=1 Tax=Demequina flava TaxID=1095025 RepID=UPI00078282BB|nr:hypothetical protein [Demequina flava]
MTAPTMRAVAIAAGFFGVSLVVAGTANAMAQGPGEQTVGAAIHLPVPEVSVSAAPSPTAAPTATEPPVTVVNTSEPSPEPIEVTPEPVEITADAAEAPREPQESEAPVEVGSAPIECSDEGRCDGNDSSKETERCGHVDAPRVTTDWSREDLREAADQWRETLRELRDDCSHLVASLPSSDDLTATWKALIESATDSDTWDDGQWRGNDGDWDDGQWHGNDGDWDDGQWRDDTGDWDN